MNSVTGSYVKDYYRQFAQAGDLLYLSGRATGETGPYGVDLTGWDILYTPPSDIWARNVSSALSIQSQCSTGGDSVGALFSIVSGGVKAAGVFSGALIGGCRIYFTPIWDSYLALPGAPLTSP